jgi:hypothetical protein
MQRSNTTKAAIPQGSSTRDSTSVARPKISAPLELIHTTNMLSYNAPDLPRPSTSSEASVKSDAESEASTPTTAASSPPTSPDVAPEEMGRSISPEPNHLSCYFQPPASAVSQQVPKAQAPAIPTRAPSHTKKASFEAISRQRSASVLSKDSGRSLSSKASFSFSRSSSGSTTASTMSHNSMYSHHHMSYKMSAPAPTQAPTAHVAPEKKKPAPVESHPFGPELAQVTEIAEEFGQKLDAIDEEEQELLNRGFCKLAADIYLRDVEALLSTFFNERDSAPVRAPIAAAAWI